ncbi:hypothetical protein Q5H93_10090 [Hymenobacter sp. ASUV-10]|uniref:CBM-cenC domain-containing protein n=1 Tax=Hymenobacter aranciens TaxID=3063996 RepID=A0ABT9BBC8_9BACT|nr:hypothetical protein [Hymenobacter sp. ASUV-10]MDO7875080.1 hypothetical protein [Hymenobacter sp. ASUV-10]
MRYAFFCLVALCLAGCSSATNQAETANILLTNSFETVSGWLPDDQTATLTHEQAHSGRTALKVDDAHEYSLTYSKPLEYFHLTLPVKLRVTAWVLRPSAQAYASLVISVTDPAAPSAPALLWQDIKLNEAGNSYGKWEKVSQVVTLPVGLQNTHKLSLYLWRTGSGAATYLDDIQVSREP